MKITRVVAILLPALLMPLTMIMAQETEGYVYPLNPSMPEWRTLPVEQKNSMLQIPGDQLTKMSTKVLIQAFVDNPFCSLMFAYNTAQEGFDRVYQEFNGVRELLGRTDIAPRLIEYYRDLPVDGYKRYADPAARARYTFRFLYLEILMSQSAIASRLDLSESKQLIGELLKKHESKVEHMNEYSMVGLESCAFAIARTLNQKGILATSGTEAGPAMRSFLDTGRLVDGKVLEKVLQRAKEFAHN